MLDQAEITRSITSRYILAVIIVAITIIGGYSYMQYQLSHRESYATIINVSGKQRMLSQRIALFSQIIAAETDREKLLEKVEKMESVIHEMEENHNKLTLSEKEGGLVKKQSFEVDSLYYLEPHTLDRRVREYISHARAFVVYSRTPHSAEGVVLPDDALTHIEYMRQEALEPLLSSLNAVVKQYQKESEESIKQLKDVETIILLVVLCILFCEVVLIFQPMAKKIAAQMTNLAEANVKAEELSGLKSDFLATMSHEMRTPMNGILGMAELIMGTRPTMQVEGYARTIISSGETLLTIIGDILDFSKIEAGKMEIESMPVDMLEVTDDVATLYSVKARDKAIELVVRYAPGSEQFVYADPVRVRQILNNLINNAIKFTEKGHVVLSVEEDKEANRTDGKVLLAFSVTDTGIGMSEKSAARVFDSFAQADGSTTRQYGGTGLGLSICKKLVELMGGEIGVQSKEGLWSNFWFKIPFERNTEER